MNPKDIRNSSDPDLAGSYAAMLRAARSAEDVAIKTNTSILVSLNGKDVELTAADLTEFSSKCTALPKDNITRANINKNLDNVNFHCLMLLRRNNKFIAA